MVQNENLWYQWLALINTLLMLTSYNIYLLRDGMLAALGPLYSGSRQDSRL
jgi:hypothetical protein